MKVSEFIFRGVPRNVREFNDEVTLILNNGKYSSSVVGTPPQWVARNGEFVFLTSSGVNRIYFYANNLWNWFGGSAAGATAAGTENQVQYNSGGTFGANSSFTFDFVNSQMAVNRTIFIGANTRTGADGDGQIALNVNAVALNQSGGVPIAAFGFYNAVQDYKNEVEIQPSRTLFGPYSRVPITGNYEVLLVAANPTVSLIGQDNSTVCSIQFYRHLNNSFSGRQLRSTISLLEPLIQPGGSVQDTSAGYLAIDPTNLTSVLSENPSLEVDDCRRAFGTTLTYQRFINIESNTIASISSTSLTNCATVYIQGASFIESNNLTVNNNYALFVDDGKSRFDGDVEINGSVNLSTNTINASVISTTALYITNGSFKTLNTVVLQTTAQGIANGDMWFEASSNRVYIGMRSNNASYYVAMDT